MLDYLKSSLMSIAHSSDSRLLYASIAFGEVDIAEGFRASSNALLVRDDDEDDAALVVGKREEKRRRKNLSESNNKDADWIRIVVDASLYVCMFK